MRTNLTIAGTLLAFALSPSAYCAEGKTACASALQPADEQGERRALRAEDLVQLRDIGGNFESPIYAGLTPGDPKAIALSPDGTKLAFEMRRGDPFSNRFCLGIFVLPLRQGERPIPIDIGGEPIMWRDNDFRGKAGFPIGVIMDRLPRWTADGKAVLFLKRVDGIVQVWRAQADGSGSRPVTHGSDDVVDFRIAGDDRTVVYKTQPGMREGLKAIEAEGLGGFHYDERYSPMTSSRPFVPGPLSYSAWAQADDPGAVAVPAGATEVALFNPDTTVPPGAMAVATSLGGDSAWLALDGERYPPQLKLSVRLAGGQVIKCPTPACPGNIADFWWTANGRLSFMHREGWDRESTAIFEWEPGKGAPRRILLTNDVLTGCVPDKNAIICLRDGSLRPRYIDRIDLPSGRDAAIYDPNPDFRALALGKVERLHWRNAQGLEAFGDLILPVGYEPGRHYPLIVVQYESRGFLLGGTGEEYPIQLFAAHGFAVLSLNAPQFVGSGAPNLAEAQRQADKDFADRRSNQSSIETAIRLVIDRGIADPARLGITGLSDGASSVYFALINSHLFSAAAFSSCCWDSSLAISVGPGSMKHFADRYPSVMSDSDPVWDKVSIAKNAARLNVPMLIQIPDDEFMSGLTAITALQDHHQPADMYVFPGEDHVKWQPAHKLAVYRRSLAWFQFWLGSDEPIDATRDELARWTLLREQRSKR